MSSANGGAIAAIVIIVIITIIIIFMIGRQKHGSRKASRSRISNRIDRSRVEVHRSRRRKHSDSSSSDSDSSDSDGHSSVINSTCCIVPAPVKISRLTTNETSVSISWFPSANADLYQASLYQYAGNPQTLVGPKSVKSVTNTIVEFDNLTAADYVVKIFSSSNNCGQSTDYTTVPFTTEPTTFTVDKLVVDEIIQGGQRTTPNQIKVSVGQYQFDCSEVNAAFPNFETHSPAKPTYAPDALWDAMLNNLSEEQVRLTQNFISGRNALGLPQFEKINSDGITGNFVELVATKTSILSSFDYEDSVRRYQTTTGWDLHCTNTLYRDFINAETVTANGSFSWSGNIGVEEGVLKLDDTSVILEFGAIVQGEGVPWGTSIYDISQADSGIYILSMIVESEPITDADLDFQASKWGPKNVSIFIQAGILRQFDGVPVIIDIYHGNRQFEPTIDYSNDDVSGLTHTGEQWIGSKAIPSDLSLDLAILSSVDVPIIQLAIFAESGVNVYFKPPVCTTSVENGRRMVTQQGGQAEGDGNSTVSIITYSDGRPMLEIISATSADDPAYPNEVRLTYTLGNPASEMGTLPRIMSTGNSNPLFNGDFGAAIGKGINGNVVSIWAPRIPGLVAGLTSTGGRMYRDEACFSGDALVLMADGAMQKKAMDVQVGDRVASLNGEVVEIIATTLHPKGQGTKRIVDMSSYAPGLIISDYHRVQIDGHWVRPCDLPNVRIYNDDIDLYNFVADRRLAIIVNGLPATTLGMYCEGGTHDLDLYPTQRFWCTDAIVDQLKSRSDWPNIVFTDSQMRDMKSV